MVQLSDICPVCGMATEAEVLPVGHHKMNFHFCSDQCRERFIAHPTLYSGKFGKEHGEVLKRRTMRLAEPLGSEVIDLLIPYLMAMMGVKAVVVEGDKVDISYDLLQVTEMQIEKALVNIGLQLGNGWVERFRRSWVRNTEEIEQDNLAAAAAPCCNKPPPGA